MRPQVTGPGPRPEVCASTPDEPPLPCCMSSVAKRWRPGGSIPEPHQGEGVLWVEGGGAPTPRPWSPEDRAGGLVQEARDSGRLKPVPSSLGLPRSQVESKSGVGEWPGCPRCCPPPQHILGPLGASGCLSPPNTPEGPKTTGPAAWPQQLPRDPRNPSQEGAQAPTQGARWSSRTASVTPTSC